MYYLRNIQFLCEYNLLLLVVDCSFGIMRISLEEMLVDSDIDILLSEPIRNIEYTLLQMHVQIIAGVRYLLPTMVHH